MKADHIARGYILPNQRSVSVFRQLSDTLGIGTLLPRVPRATGSARRYAAR